MRSLCFILLLAVSLAGCSHGFQDLKLDPGGVSMISGKGTVRHQDFEGGFFGIVGDDSTNYDPVELAAAFRKDGLRVKFSGSPANGGMSTHMWGKRIELTSIELLK